MRRRRAGRAAALASALLLAPGAARASGFLLYEQSARAVAMGSAVSASVRDPSAVWFNPAALAFLPPAGAAVTAGVLRGRTRFAPAGGGAEEEARTGLRVVPNLFLHGAVAPRVQLGLGLYPPFGLAVEWPEGWVGTEQALSTDLRIVSANPTGAVRLSDTLALAAGVAVLRGTVALATAIPEPPGGRADLTGGGWAVAANAAVLWRPRPDTMHVAATYRSRATVPFRGDARFAPGAPGYEQMLRPQRVSADLTLPDLLTLGAMVRPHPRLELDAQIDWTLWSAFDELHIRFEEAALDRRVARSRVNPLTFRFGAEGRVREWLSLRAGASLDQSASRPDALAPSAPDAVRLGLGAGAGVAFGRVTVDLGYLYAHFLAAEAVAPSDPEGTYRTRAHVLALTIAVR